MIAFATAWAWLKKWWKWLLLPIGAGLWLLGRATAKTKIVVASPELQEHAELEQGWAAEADQKKTTAAVEKRIRDELIEKDYTESMEKVHQKVEDASAGLENDPILLTNYLKKAGKNVHKS